MNGRAAGRLVLAGSGLLVYGLQLPGGWRLWVSGCGASLLMSRARGRKCNRGVRLSNVVSSIMKSDVFRDTCMDGGPH